MIHASTSSLVSNTTEREVGGRGAIGALEAMGELVGQTSRGDVEGQSGYALASELALDVSSSNVHGIATGARSGPTHEYRSAELGFVFE
jgi:hypothetical protein